jgi:DNA-binding winged helix-turn-helix (wHTH) protein
MQVEIVRWPSEEARLADLRSSGRPRLVLVRNGVTPPLTPDVLEDWIRLPASDEDVHARVRVLEDRMRGVIEDRVPEIDESGLLHLDGAWVSLSPVELRLVTALIDRYRAVVSRESLARAGWPDGIPGRNVLDVHIVRLRRRLAPLGLVIRTVRSRGYLLELGRPDQAPAVGASRPVAVPPPPTPSVPTTTSDPYPSTTVPTGPI